MAAPDRSSQALMFLILMASLTHSCRAPRLQTSEALAVGSGVYAIKSRQSGKCLDVPFGRPDDGLILQQSDCNNNPAQLFEVIPLADGYVRLQNVASGKAVDVQERRMDNGAPIQQSPYQGLESQQFRLAQREEGSYAIIGRASGRVLEVLEKSNESGAKIQQWKDSHAPNQQWFLIKRGSKRNPDPVPDHGVPSIGSVDENAWRLVWSDEFNGNQIDRSKWGFENLKPGTVNNERQGYTDRPENARVKDGKLVIETRKDYFNGMPYSSARMLTRGKASWKYGRIEARLKFTSALGSWPAFWMMPEDQSQGWPTCGEMDIMENVGFEGDIIHGTTHTQRFSAANGRRGTRTIPNVTADFHTYAIHWYADRIEWYADGKQYFVQRNDGGNEVYPFHKKFHIILNFALGGDWGGLRGFDENMPNQRMTVDYVRVYQK